MKQDGLPKPIILLGKNGAGKTTLLSSIADSFFEIARDSGFGNVLPKDGAGHKYFKVSGGTNQKHGSGYGLCFIKYTNNIQYLNKSGVLSNQDCLKHIAEINLLNGYTDEGSNKLNNVALINNNDIIKNDIEKNSYLYFPSDRFEYPEWMVDDFINENFDDKTTFGGELGRKILVRNNLNNIKQWIKNVILDSRVEMGMSVVDGQSQYGIIPQHVNNLWFAASKINIELILSKIVEQTIKLNLGYRVHGNRRLSLIDGSNNIVVPSLESLSAGQSTLLSVFCSIIQASDMQNINKSVHLDTIEGIVLIDEVDLHLHIKLQKDILPQLIKLFPKVQFIVSSHSPFFLKGMHDVFGDDMLMVNMPDGEILNDFNAFEEFENAFKLFDSLGNTYKQEIMLLKSKISNQQKPLVITEGKTDWKHLKAALNYFKSVGEYVDLDIEFLEDTETRGDSVLEAMLDSSRRLPNQHHIIGVFDRDNPRYTKKYYEAFHALGNKVFAFCIPEPSHRSGYSNISIEFYYTDEEVNQKLPSGTALFFDNQFSECITKIASNNDRCFNVLSNPDVATEKAKKVYDTDLETTLNKGKNPKIAHSKEVFATNVLDGEFINQFKFDEFRKIFDIIQNIISN